MTVIGPGPCRLRSLRSRISALVAGSRPGGGEFESRSPGLHRGTVPRLRSYTFDAEESDQLMMLRRQFILIAVQLSPANAPERGDLEPVSRGPRELLEKLGLVAVHQRHRVVHAPENDDGPIRMHRPTPSRPRIEG